jgi:hypothetical protein
MYAIVEDNNITQYINNPKSVVIGDVRYPAKIFSAWTASELAAIGIIEVTFDNTNKKDEQWYINTNQTYTYDASAGTVTAAYGTATAKAHADTLYTQEDVDNDVDDNGDRINDFSVGDVATRGLKYNLIKDLKITVANELAKTDWYITRNTEKSTAIPSAISTHRDAVRTKQAEMETAITNASDTPALETLYTYTKQEDGSVTRPLGELPRLES